MNNFKTGDMVEINIGERFEVTRVNESTQSLVLKALGGAIFTADFADVKLIKPVDCEFKIGDTVYWKKTPKTDSKHYFTVKSFTRNAFGLVHAICDCSGESQGMMIAAHLGKVKSEPVPEDPLKRLYKKGDRVKVTFDNSSHIVLEDQKPGYAGVMLDHFTLSGIKGECRVNSAYIKLIVPEQLEPAKAPEQPELKAGMYVEHTRYGIAKVKDLDGYLFLKIPGFKGIVAAQHETLKPSWKNQDALKEDYHAARKRVWEESEAGKAARDRELLRSMLLKDTLFESLVSKDSVGVIFPGMLPVFDRMEKTEELKNKEKNMAVNKHINTLMCSPNPALSGGLRDLFVMAEELKKKEETKRFKVGDMLTMPGEVFSYEVIKDTGGEFIHVKNQITGIDKAVKRKDVSPILDARISDTGKVLNAKTADIYAKTDEAPASGADRLNAGKLQWSLVDFTALEPMVRVLMKGAQKYSPDNWKKGLSYTSILDSTMRHMTAFKAGEDLDPETGEPHTAHMLCNLMFLAWEELNRKDLDNRKPDLSK